MSLRETRRLLESRRIRPSRRLGQNFLIDGNIVAKSLQLARIAPGDTVVEIGPGLGTLTRALLEAGCRVYAVEKDVHLFTYLRDELADQYPERLFLMQGDAVDSPLADLPGNLETPFKIVANLPYAISTPWLDGVLSNGRLPERMVLMLQRETADRFTAEPGGKAMGAITVFLRSAYTTERGHRVPRQCFHPVPEVDSYLLNLIRKESPHLFPPATKALIRQCFGQRRKQIGSLLKKFASPATGEAWLQRLAAEGHSPRSRPEEIPLALWADLDPIE